ncbi:hypothetical protein [Azospirillum agricola]|nr:hypothetical protein [Azospirillum agricola]MBP2229459.1 hypothetical protein [Azospirillum agricola]SMH36967.1 hypothetical protein SAMN02982994_1119 [Azospirillum lipoferum]
MLARLGRGLAPLAARLWRVTALTTGSGLPLTTESGDPLILGPL